MSSGWWTLNRMDLLFSGLLGVVAFVVLVVSVMSALGVGDRLVAPLIALFSAPLVRLSRGVNAVRVERSIKRLPPGVPPPPPTP